MNICIYVCTYVYTYEFIQTYASRHLYKNI